MKYISKPVVVDAMQYTGNNRNEIIRWLKVDMNTITQPPGYTGLHVQTARGVMSVTPNDYLIKRNDYVDIMSAGQFEKHYSRPTLSIMKSRQFGKAKTLSDWFDNHRRKDTHTVKLDTPYWKRSKD